MSPPELRRPPAGTEGQMLRDGREETVHRTADEIRSRHDAALRCEPLRQGVGLYRHDPWLEAQRSEGRSAFGLRRHELLAEVERRKCEGWAQWELLDRFANPTTVAA